MNHQLRFLSLSNFLTVFTGFKLGHMAFARAILSFCFITAALSVAFQTKALAADPHSEVIGACVICNDPGKVYQCTYKPSTYHPETTGHSPSINIKGLQFACIQEIAQYGGHGQCAADRRSYENCNGEVYHLKNSRAVEQIFVPAHKPKDDQSLQGQELKPTKKPQPTLVDETQKTYKKTTKTVKKTINKTTKSVQKTYDKTSDVVKKSVKSVGKGIGDAASTTYDCLTSFFQKCGK